MRYLKPHLAPLIWFAVSHLHRVAAFSSNANFLHLCNAVRLDIISDNPSLQDDTNLECRPTYNPDKPPATAVYITVWECLERCPGYESSKFNILNQWIGPLVGFLLPALAFVVTIPRPIRIPRKEEWFGLRMVKGVPWLAIAVFLTTFDIMVWIVLVFAFAGPLIAGAAHEAIIDHVVLNFAEHANSESARAAVTFSLVGSLKPREGDLWTKVSEYIVNSCHARPKLLALLDLLPTYGARVGVPIVFYLGAYAYALCDSYSKLGDNDTAHAVAFGLWYGVVVLVAIVSSSILGVDNPASLEAVFSEVIHTQQPVNGVPGHPLRTSRPVQSHSYHFHDSPFRMVWLWEQARVYDDWTRKYTLDEALRSKIKAAAPKTLSGLIASTLIALPCAGACWISYQTPEIGFGCRSVAHLIYASSQIILIMVWWLYYSSQHRIQQVRRGQRYTYTSIPVYAITALALAAAMISSMGGTIMQLVGVFRNCICKASLKYVLPKYRSQAVVLVTNDTQKHRDHAKNWLVVGGIGIGIIGLVAAYGWGYQARTRARCRRVVENL